MAYTYDDFVTAAQGAGLYDKFSADDLSIAQTNPEYGLSMLKLQQDANNATTTEQKLLLQEAANQLRTSYNAPATQAQKNGSFVYSKENEYQKALNEVLNRDPFSYDRNQDPVFQSLRKSYLREGERSMENTLARASAGSEGIPSTYAITAAQQANDYYNTKLHDIIPSLEQTAYQRYLNDFNEKLGALGALDTDRNFEFGLNQDEWNKAWTMYKTMGYATPEIAAILGIPYVPPGRAAATAVGGSGRGSKSAADAIAQYEAFNAEMDGMIYDYPRPQDAKRAPNALGRGGGTFHESTPGRTLQNNLRG